MMHDVVLPMRISHLIFTHYFLHGPWTLRFELVELIEFSNSRVFIEWLLIKTGGK